jgi:hypothetical protein
MLISFLFFACHFWWAKRKILCEKYISYIFHVFSEARDHILILNMLFFNKLRQIIPEVRSEMRDLLIFIFILKTTGTFTPVHSAGYLILRNEFRSTQEIARHNIQVSFYIQSTGLWPNTWIHVSQYMAIIWNAMHILWPVNFTPKGWRHVQGIYTNNVHKSNRQKHNKNRK